MNNIDEIDMKILQALTQDSRTTFNKMSQLLNLSEAGIRKRVLALEDKKIIKKFTIELDPSKIGINSISFVGLDVEPTKLLEAIEKLCSLPEVRRLATSSGDHMVVMEVWTENGKELTKFIAEKIRSIEGVTRICPAIIQDIVKE
jgi:Lrp/AsnC family transcriptional regulator, regulator for asnA, asnC and gidA